MSGVFGNGVALTVGSAIANITNISGVGSSADVLDVTVHGSDDKYREFVAGLRDGGEISIDGNFVGAAEANTVLTTLDAGTLTEGATITFPTTPVATFTFDGIWTSYEVSAPHDGIMTFTATIKISGKPAFTAAS